MEFKRSSIIRKVGEKERGLYIPLIVIAIRITYLLVQVFEERPEDLEIVGSFHVLRKWKVQIQ